MAYSLFCLMPVLILILLEVGLLEFYITVPKLIKKVLILILLEVGLLVSISYINDIVLNRLNPYSTGSWVAGYLTKFVGKTDKKS